MIKKKALIMVDLQNDFCEGGRLAVPLADEVVPLANQLQPYFELVVATKDWHPQDHMSFAINHPGCQIGDIVNVDGLSQVLWPEHCVQHSKGAEFHPKLDVKRVKKIVHKGVDKKIDSYSAFFDNAHQRSTGLSEYLREEQVEDVYIMGLATDYCVKYSTLDALHLGFTVYIIENACRGVELHPGDIAGAIEEVCDAGAILVSVEDIIDRDEPKVAAF